MSQKKDRRLGLPLYLWDTLVEIHPNYLIDYNMEIHPNCLIDYKILPLNM